MIVEDAVRYCPCAAIRAPHPPSFVGDHYYCESAGDTGVNNEDAYYTTDYNNSVAILTSKYVSPIIVDYVMQQCMSLSIQYSTQYRD